MRVALANAKGGVAKTTSCIYLAAVLARRGIEVAVYDADPQSSASLWAAAAEQAGDPLPFDVLPANMATLAHLGGAPATKEWSIIDAPPQGPLLDKTLAVGAAWARIFPNNSAGYGTIDTATPEVSISLLPDWRNRGIGHRLMTALLDRLRTDGHAAASLSVQRTNANALHLYESLGFTIISEHDGELVMRVALAD